MKKIILKIIILILIFSLCSCSIEEKDYTVTKNGITYQVDVSEKQISDGKNIYYYTINESDKKTDIKIIYPNGSSYFEMRQGNGSASGWSEGYDEENYPSGEILCDVVVNERKLKSERIAGLSLAAVLAGSGLFMILIPGSWLWNLKYSWMFKNAEPSEAALNLHYVLGGICIIVAIGFAVNAVII